MKNKMVEIYIPYCIDKKYWAYLFHVLFSDVLYVFIVVVIDCCFFVSCAFQPVVAVINHLLTYNRWKFLSNWICVICYNSSVNTSN